GRGQFVEQGYALVLRERLEQDRARVELASGPAGPLVEQLGPRKAEQEHRRVAAQVDDVLDQVEQRRLGPVDVLEDGDERALPGERLEQAPHSPRGLRGARTAA